MSNVIVAKAHHWTRSVASSAHIPPITYLSSTTPHVHFSSPLQSESGCIPKDFRTKILYVNLVSPMQASCQVHRSLLDIIILTILGVLYKSPCSIYVIS
jgi:hypothetical protein